MPKELPTTRKLLINYQFYMTQHGTYPKPFLPYHFLINRIYIIFRCRFFGCIHDLLDNRNIILGKVICNLFSRKRFLHFLHVCLISRFSSPSARPFCIPIFSNLVATSHMLTLFSFAQQSIYNICLYDVILT